MGTQLKNMKLIFNIGYILETYLFNMYLNSKHKREFIQQITNTYANKPEWGTFIDSLEQYEPPILKKL